MSSERHAQLFRNGRNQAVRIPREFEFTEKEVIMHKEGERLIIEPVKKHSLRKILAALKPLQEDFPDIEDPTAQDEEIF